MLGNAHKNSRDAMMDFLKGISIIFIVITHFKWSAEQRLAYCFPFWIDMAMPIFMLIAGYMGAMSFERHQISTLVEGYQFKGLVRRFMRFLIPFVLLVPCDVICGVANNPSSWKGVLFTLILGGGRGQVAILFQ